jgi:hypothetical protein
MDTRRALLSENMKMERFVYDLLPTNHYFSNNPTDGRLESRLIGPDNSILYGPRKMAQESEKQDRAHVLDLTEDISRKAGDWHFFEPELTVMPQEDLLLDFSFRNEPLYKGVLILKSRQGDYREYLLDAPGNEEAFGAEEYHSHVIRLWNSTDKPVEYTFVFLSQGPDAAHFIFDHFARVKLSHFGSASHAIETKGFIPYHVTVRTQKPALLETPRVFLPGYESIVDGVRRPVVRSREALVAVPLDAGSHDVVVRFAGTLKLRLAACCSGVAWLVFLLTRFGSQSEIELPLRET